MFNTWRWRYYEDARKNTSIEETQYKSCTTNKDVVYFVVLKMVVLFRMTLKNVLKMVLVYVVLMMIFDIEDECFQQQGNIIF